MYRGMWRKGKEWTAGIRHLVLAYVWFILAVVVAPLFVAGGAAGVEVAGSRLEQIREQERTYTEEVH